ncbi:EamA family transporter [bacterium AH-315-J04]|nr:EamA family transporter [bacterium AH-315-J04]
MGVIYLVWGSTFFAIRLAIDTIPPFIMAGTRFTLAGILLYAFVRLRNKTEKPTFAQWRSASLVGCLMLLGGNGMISWAELYVPTGLAALMVGMVPLWMALLDWAFYRGPRPNTLMISGLGMGFFGLYALVGAPNLGGNTVDPTGAIVIVLACGSWALGSLQSRRANLPKSPLLATAMQMLSAGVALILLGTCCGEWTGFDIFSVTLTSCLSVLYLTLFGSILAFSCYVWLLRVTTAARVSTYAYVNPLIAILLGAAFLGEEISSRVILAGIAIIMAVVMINLSKTRAASHHTSPEYQDSKELKTPRDCHNPHILQVVTTPAVSMPDACRMSLNDNNSSSSSISSDT